MINSFSDSIRILHVDDDPDFTELTCEFLEQENDRFVVETAPSARAGLDRLHTAEFDCVVSDYDMPRQNGIEFLEAVRAEKPELPFILFTGKGSEEVASDAISAGVTDYLQKEHGTEQYTVLANRITNAVEHFRSQQVVERSETRLREIIDSLPHHLFAVDKDGQLILANEVLAEFHDSSVGAIEGEELASVLGDRVANRLRTDISDVLASDTSKWASTIELADSSGETHLFELQLLPYDGPGADTQAVLGIAAEITERRERETEFEQTRERMQLALEQTDSVIFEIDCDSDTVIRHGAYREFFDLEPDETPTWRGHLEQAVHPDDRARFHQFYRQLTNGDRESGELEYRTNPDMGRVRWIRDSAFIQADSHTDSQQIIGIARDVTEYKERKLELRQKERQYQAIFDDPNILVGLVDTDGTVVDINETAMEYVDATRADVIGKPFWESPWFDHSAALRGRVKTWIDRAASGEYVEFEADLRKSTGEQYTVEGVFRPVTNEEGEVVSVIVSDRDITERKQRERELEQYEAYLQESNDIITVLDESGTVQYQSPSVTRILGYERDELLGVNGFELVHPDDIDDLFEKFTDLVSRPDETITAEARFRTADGEWRWLEVRGKNQLDHPVINGIVTNNRDITDRKDYERELERTNALLSTLFKTLPVGVIAEDESRNVLTVNERLFELFEISETPDEVIGRDCEAMAGDVSTMFDRPDEFTERIRTLVDTRESTWDEQLHLTDGRTFKRRYEPIELPDGDGHLWVYSDNTAQKTREKRLEALNETAQELITAETAQEVAEIGAHAASDILQMNANAVHLYDDKRSALVPVAVTDAGRELVGDPPAFTDGDSIAWRVYETGEPLALDDVHADPDIYNPDSPAQSELHLPIGERGLLIACSNTTAAFDEADIVMGEILARTIATALEQVEQTDRLRERERELTRQNNRLEEFAGVISHDLRNPLRVAEGRLELLQEECENEHLRALDRALNRMDTLIDDLLTLAREGEEIQDLESVEVAALAQRCWHTVETADAALETHTTRKIRADSSRLQQLFENLIRNAVEHGGRDVTVTVGDMEDGFYVSDDGPGIPPNEQEDIFEVGYSTIQDGTGFGLAIVKEIADAHEWELSITDSDAGGLRVEITGVHRS
ncbi:hypothetical protein Harman_00110 [Haloarcula mannanilytica]|uniref:histidine kinase n=1 Tax=Haloarcula mannanilytica TaxID=2509225 RepID=A0A4C2EC63_9EURY|nr:PAS domain S-box protein [Haloarcula mannanilytica]GCF12076.1 hypothetical protein Harman_00110 [Haloarcula mannanilytica]